MSLQILIVGKSHEHIFEVIRYFKPTNIILISSPQIRQETMKLFNEIQSLKIKSQIVFVDPFRQTTITDMINTYNEILKPYTKVIQKITINIGLTGGTNIMAISAALAALIFGLDVHYWVKNNPVPIIWNLNNEIKNFPFLRTRHLNRRYAKYQKNEFICETKRNSVFFEERIVKGLDPAMNEEINKGER